jgi:arylsulfatase
MNAANMPSLDRREFIGAVTGGIALTSATLTQVQVQPTTPDAKPPNVLFIMTDQQRYDTIAALGNPHIYTPNFDRLVARGVTFTNGYSTCPVCVPARATIRTGCEPPTTGIYGNAPVDLVAGQADSMEERCGPYLARTMRNLGYRTFGIGKFHTRPWDEDLGYDVHLHSEELYGSPDQRARDSYASYIKNEHPDFDYIEMLMGERSEMYYMPQASALPAHLGVEAWASDRAIEQIKIDDGKPFFGFVSFIGPHPPLAPPIPFNRMYNPDKMPEPVLGDIAVDHIDEQIPWMNHAIFAENVATPLARALKARYYGELSYIDHCLGRILNALEARPDAENTLICFYSDHGDHLGDHYGWQKESFFDVACHVPFLVSWPAKLPKNVKRDELVCLTDLFGIATTAAGKSECREGINVLGILDGSASAREHLVGYYGKPGTQRFKVMVRKGPWKYIYFANGGQSQLFNLADDPHELKQLAGTNPEVVKELHAIAAEACKRANADRALDATGSLAVLPIQNRPLQRIYQFDPSRGVKGWPGKPGDVLTGDFNGGAFFT